MTLIRVTAFDVREGRPGKGASCPVARSIRRQRLLGLCVHVGSDRIEWMADDGWRSWEVPAPLRARLANYDETGTMEPFSFELDERGTVRTPSVRTLFEESP